MAKENISKFFEAVQTEEELKQKIEAIDREYREQGQELTESQRIMITGERILPLAADRGLHFTIDELKDFETEQLEKFKGDGEISQQELETAVVGGVYNGAALCFIIGLGRGEHGLEPLLPALCVLFGS